MMVPPKMTQYTLWGFLLILTLCTIWSYVGTLTSTPDVTASAYQEAFKTIAAEIGPQDLILIHPPWREDVVTILSKTTQQARDIRTTLPAHQWSMGKIILLKDRNGPPLSKRLLNMNRSIKSQAHSDIDIQFLSVKAASTDIDFITLLSTASVEVRSDKGRVTQCKWQNKTRRHICPGQPKWIYVGPHDMSSGNDSKTCIWGHPTKNGSLSITFPNPPLQSKLEFEHALSSNAVRSNNRSPVTAELFLDDKLLKKLSRSNQMGFQTSTISTPQSAAKRLELKIKTKKDGARHYCFNLRAKMSEERQ